MYKYTLLVRKSRKAKIAYFYERSLTYLGMIAVGKERRPLLKPWLTSYFADSVHCHLEKSVSTVKKIAKRLEILGKLLDLDKDEILLTCCPMDHEVFLSFEFLCLSGNVRSLVAFQVVSGD